MKAEDVEGFLALEPHLHPSCFAVCIGMHVLVKGEEGGAEYVVQDIVPFLPILMTHLSSDLCFPPSEENLDMMDYIMDVLRVADFSSDVAESCISELTSILIKVCQNPISPTFNHCLFEAVAILIRRACVDVAVTSAFETSLLPTLQDILTNNMIEFFHYAFQVLAQLVELNSSYLANLYWVFLDQLLLPDLWKKSSHVPDLVRLLQAFLRMTPSEPYIEGRLQEVLGIFEMLVSSPSTQVQGFLVLDTFVENFGYDVIAPYMRYIWPCLFSHLKNNKTGKFVRRLVILMSRILVKHGWKNLVDSINRIHPNLFLMILEQFWIPILKQITGVIEVKLTAVASTRLICECPLLLYPAAATKWGQMLDSIVTLISMPEQDRVTEELQVPDFVETDAFFRLENAGKKEDDPLKGIMDPKAFLVSSLSNLIGFPGGYHQVITENLDAANHKALSLWLIEVPPLEM